MHVERVADQNARKEHLMQQVRSDMALAGAQTLIEVLPNEKCFLKCITKPSTSLSAWEQGCLGHCMDRYMEAFNIVSRTYVQRLSQEAESMRGNSSSSSSL
ncbi:hypothetical protein BS47DRAFT_1295998 [Hydnum rufescens UP504]|uniref:Mitochondrial import inner membrane translocase subunit n=1 Tax=Hydnum rufescens UP504 TaxID=1448309 RepID=A0A9P6AX27_9AGAM|nr:hypothetical protein BS47DRAFT_1295998 [Hydnum rufescens UP504]